MGKQVIKFLIFLETTMSITMFSCTFIPNLYGRGGGVANFSYQSFTLYFGCAINVTS